MPELNKPSDKPRWATATSDIATPPESKRDLGWQMEKPALQFFNWLHKMYYEWIIYLENKTDMSFGGKAVSALTLSGTSITPTGSSHTVTPGAPSTGTLSTIVPTNFSEGRLLALRGTAGKTLTITHSTATNGIRLSRNTNTTLRNVDDVLVLELQAGGHWQEVTRSATALVTDPLPFLSAPLDANAQNINNVNKVTAAALDTSANGTLTIGASALNINIGTDSSNVFLFGSTVSVTTSNSVVTDKLVRFNSGGLANSADGSGFEIEEGGTGVITGFFKTGNSRNSYLMKAPGRLGAFRFTAPNTDFQHEILSNATAFRSVILPDASGTVALLPSTGVNGDVLQGGNAFGAVMRLGTNDNNNLVLEANNTDRITLRPASAANADGVIHGTAGVTLPAGTTAQRPTTPVVGTIRYNSSTGEFEGYANSIWAAVGGGLAVDEKASPANATFVAQDKRNHLVNTTNGTVTATLPAGTTGATIRFTDAAETWGIENKNLIIAPATGQAIDGLATNETLVMDISGAWVEMMWSTAMSKWVIAGSTSLAGAASIINGGQSNGADLSIGTNDNYNLSLRAGNIPRVFISTSGSVQLGSSDHTGAHTAYTGSFLVSRGGNTLLSDGEASNIIATDNTNTRARIFAYKNSGMGSISVGVIGLNNGNSGGEVYLWQRGGIFYYSTTAANIGTTTGTQISTVSDSRLKKEIQDYTEPALEKIKHITPKTFYFKDELDKRHYTGFIAQELMEVFPTGVRETEICIGKHENILNLDTTAILALSVKAIKELHAELESLKAEIAVLKGGR